MGPLAKAARNTLVAAAALTALAGYAAIGSGDVL